MHPTPLRNNHQSPLSDIPGPYAMTDATSTPGHEDPFEIIDSPWGHIEQWRASTLATGTMGALAQVYDIVRADAAEAVARADAMEARKALVQRLCDQVVELQARINTLADALEARHRADVEARERQQELDEEPIEEPPGTSADAPAGRHNTGDLHDLPAPEDPTRTELEEADQEFELPEDKLPEPPVLQTTAIEFDDH